MKGERTASAIQRTDFLGIEFTHVAAIRLSVSIRVDVRGACCCRCLILSHSLVQSINQTDGCLNITYPHPHNPGTVCTIQSVVASETVQQFTQETTDLVYIPRTRVHAIRCPIVIRVVVPSRASAYPSICLLPHHHHTLVSPTTSKESAIHRTLLNSQGHSPSCRSAFDGQESKQLITPSSSSSPVSSSTPHPHSPG